MSSSSSFAKLQELLPQLFQSSNLTGNLYLRCRINTSDTFLIPMAHVRESLLIDSNNITPIPQVSSFVMGLMSSREKVFCVIDLSQLMGFAPLGTYARQYHLVVISVSSFLPDHFPDKETLLGLAVNYIEGITRVETEKPLSLEKVSSSLPQEKINYWLPLNHYLDGWVKINQKPFPLLNLHTIIQATL